MKKKTNFKKTATTFMLVLCVLPVLAKQQPPTEPVSDTTAFGIAAEEEMEPGIQPLSDDEPTEKIKK